MNTLQHLITEELTKRHLSYRKAAQEIGIAHTTLIRIAAGVPCDVPTVQKIAVWLGVSPSTLVDTLDTDDDSELVKAVAAIIVAEPELADVFLEAGRRMQAGTMDPEQIRELARYAAYRFNIGKEAKGDEEQPTAVRKRRSAARG